MDDGIDKRADVETWQRFFLLLRRCLRRFGTEDADQGADCWVDDEHWGRRQQKVYVRNLELLRPAVVNAMQALLTEFPGWEIMVAVAVPGEGDAWPDMGLTIRAHEIIDGLQRPYFPERFRSFHYAGSRPGTERD
jgi:hypothetical protein